jgi:hypothetical protein
VTEYRTPDQEAAQQQEADRIAKVLEQAVRDGTSLVAAMALGEPPDVVERWVDAVWNGLRDGLSDDRTDRNGLRQEDRLMAIVMLLNQRMHYDAHTILRSVREVP